jgi:hypothetical protein
MAAAPSRGQHDVGNADLRSKSMSNGVLNNVTVQPAGGGAAILVGGNGTQAKNRVTLTGNWAANPIQGQQYTISVPGKSTLHATCAGFQITPDRRTGNQIAEGTFNIT